MIAAAVPVSDPSQVAEARRKVAALAKRHGADEAEQGRLALVVTELGTNLIKHAGGGQIVAVASTGALGVLALDRGPGMANPRACMEDGYSTAGTLGHGLGAVRRQSGAMDIASWPGLGTAVLARVALAAVGAGAGARADTGGADAEPDASSVAAIVVAKPGEDACGDDCRVWHDRASRSFFVVDGLGHGPNAAQVAHEAVLQAGRSAAAEPTQLVADVHRALRPTRGGAIAIARFDIASGVVTFAGLGNIAGLIAGRDGRSRRMVSLNGTAGHNARKIQGFDYPGANGLLIMHSDGLDTRLSLDRYPGVQGLDPLLIAGLLYRDHCRGHDDATVLVAKL